MLDKFEILEATVRSWAWKSCPFCASQEKPKTISAQLGGYQEEIALECQQCKKSIKYTTDWSPTAEVQLINEYSEKVEGKLCPYLSIQRKGENEYLLRCCSQIRDECLGKNPEHCDCYHYMQLKEHQQNGDLARAITEAELAIKIFKEKHPDWSPPNGMFDLVELKRRTLDRSDWIKWVNNQISDAKKSGDLSLAAWIAFKLAETYGILDFWQVSSDLFGEHASKLKIDKNKGGYWEQEKRNKEIKNAEILSLETLSEISNCSQKAALLRQAGNKRHEVFENSVNHHSPEYLMEARYFVNYAHADPKDSPEYYKKASDFLRSILDKLTYEREKIYHEGHANFLEGLQYLALANVEDKETINALDKSVEAFEKAIALSQRINLDANGVITIVNCIKAVACIEKFTRTQDVKLMDAAAAFLADAKKMSLSQEHILQVIYALLQIHKKILSAVENPQEAINLLSQATKKIDELSSLVPALQFRNTPIPNVIESQLYYFKEYINSISKNASSFAGKNLTFNNVKTSLDSFKNLVENQLFYVFTVTPKPLEEIGRSLIQVLFCSSFPNNTLQFREVQVAEGRSDNLLIVDMAKYPFEVKIWRGSKYYKKGLSQIKYYMDKENVEFGFYVTFDNRVRGYKSGGDVIPYGNKKIYHIFVHISNKKQKS
jgi:hypothetical protein